MKKILYMSLVLIVLTTAGFSTISFSAVEPPALLNYQGILRDSSDKPLDSSYEMIFLFFSADIGGDEILIDEHFVAGTGPVKVTDGLFNVPLGGGNVLDGSGPGTYTSLSDVFRDYDTVYLEVRIYNNDTSLWETLSPRIRVLSSAYALNSDHFDGRNSDYFIDTSSTAQTKSAQFTADASAIAGTYGIKGYGQTGGGYFEDTTSSGRAYVGYGDYGINSRGNFMGGFFMDLDQSGRANVGYWDRGIEGYGNDVGGYFEDSDNSGYAYVAYGDQGIRAFGSVMGGYFKDSDGTGITNAGFGDYGIQAFGDYMGGYFYDSNSSSYTYISWGDTAIGAYGNNGGGYFEDLDSSGRAYVGWGDYGIDANGDLAGGHFEDSNGTGRANVAFGHYGIQAYGNSGGGHFYDWDHSGVAYPGKGNYGIEAYGNTMGAYFYDADSSGVGYAGYGNYGLYGYGSYTGGYFYDTNSSGLARVGYSSYKTQGTGTNAFIQNHPSEKDKVIVYNSPEGDEVATYTRGSARLVNGEAHVRLGESFQWVTNPDIGLTAHITPHDLAVPLAIASLTTEELIVRGPAEGPQEIVFDYIIYGLRIGFEEVSIVQEKQQESWIPSMKDHRDLYASHPELRSFNALERFKQMKSDIGMTEALNLARAEVLKNAIHEYDPDIDGAVDKDRPERSEEPAPSELEDQASREGVAYPPSPIEANGEDELSQSSEKVFGLPMDDEGNIYGKSFRPTSPDLASNLQVVEKVEVGDVLVADPDQPDLFRPGYKAYDPGVVGIVAGEAGVVLGAKMPEEISDELDAAREEESIIRAPVSLSGIVLCKVDASYGSINIGDLLTTSPTPGHAMQATEPQHGTILGKALEPLDAGTGLIKVLAMMR
jgi:hypothetical protein